MPFLTPTKVTYAAPKDFPKLRNLISSTVKIIRSGGELVPTEIKEQRLDICRTRCPGQHWDQSGNLGLGKCSICGCCQIKHQFASMACPIGAWKQYET